MPFDIESLPLRADWAALTVLAAAPGLLAWAAACRAAGQLLRNRDRRCSKTALRRHAGRRRWAATLSLAAGFAVAGLWLWLRAPLTPPRIALGGLIVTLIALASLAATATPVALAHGRGKPFAALARGAIRRALTLDACLVLGWPIAGLLAFGPAAMWTAPVLAVFLALWLVVAAVLAHIGARRLHRAEESAPPKRHRLTVSPTRPSMRGA